ncbi:MAG: type IV secretory system conjugative DNA transfer family protein [Alphaproteobacteria bacterium]|nr:type IV secretory system conjugative DNA transfer family protein [Alphaproteobacteria bacterium]
MAGKFKFLSVSGEGKGLDIFNSKSYKEHEQAPVARICWEIRWWAGIWLICALAFGLSFAIEHIWRYGWSDATQVWVWVYLKNFISSFGISAIAEIPYWISRTVAHPDIASITPILPVIAYYFLADATLVSEFNPNGKDKYDEKSSRKANAEDIKKMRKYADNKEGLFNGFCTILGYFKDKGKLKPLMLDDTLSTLCVAPPGTGKSAGVVIPTILECDTMSMIINDPKPELDMKTSAYRATIGPVFILNWGGQDEPEKGIYYPSWNPLSPEHVPYNPEKRDLYVDAICKVLVPDAKGSADPHWAQTGRAGLAGLVHFIISKIERAKANDYFYSRISSGTFNDDDKTLLGEYYLSMMNDPNAYAAYALLQRNELNITNFVPVGTWEHIPDAWHGKEASFSMILDWITASQVDIAQQMEEKKQMGDQMLMMEDPIKDLFLNAVDESRKYAYSSRAVAELTQLANTPDKERGSILSTMMEGLNIFRNAAVRNRTSHSDFHFSDLRGMKDPRDGKIKPVSIYLSINLVDAQALNPITAIFIELMSNYLIAHKPGDIVDGEKVGPCDVLFVLDEMPKMQKLDAVIQGPDLGRGQRVSYLIIAQDLHQIQEKYGPDAASTIISTTAAKIVLRQNDPDSAKRFVEMIGNKIVEKIEKDKDGKDVAKPKEEELYSMKDIMKLEEEKQLVIYQGFYHRPIEATQVRYYNSKTEIEKKLNAKYKMGKAAPLPEFLIPFHHAVMGYEGTPKYLDPQTKEVKILEPVK